MPDRTVAPPFQKTIALTLPQPSVIGSVGSSSVFHLSGLRQNIVKTEVVFTAGKWAEPKIGVSHFTSMMLEKGTKTKNSVEISAALDLYGASLEISPGFDFVSVSLYVLRSKLRDIFPLFIEILSSPDFHTRELSMMADIFRQNLRVNNEKTSYIASRQIRAKVFGELHPYGTTVEEADVDALVTGDLSSFFQSSFSVHSAYVLGDLSDADLRWLTEGFSQLRQVNVSDRAGTPHRASAAVAENEKAGRTQATLRLGKKSILRSHPDYADLILATHLLGGFFGSRLMKNIREEKGLTYGISASLNAFQHDSLLVIGADVNKENVPLALTEIRRELRELCTDLVTNEELTLAKNHFSGSLQTDMANLFSVEEKVKAIQMNGLPANFYRDLLIRIDQISPADLQQTAVRYFDEISFEEVVVG